MKKARVIQLECNTLEIPKFIHAFYKNFHEKLTAKSCYLYGLFLPTCLWVDISAHEVSNISFWPPALNFIRAYPRAGVLREWIVLQKLYDRKTSHGHNNEKKFWNTIGNFHFSWINIYVDTKCKIWYENDVWSPNFSF